MKKNAFVRWAEAGIAVVLVYWLFGWQVLLVVLILILLVLETLVKGLILNAVSPPKFIPAEPDRWPDSSESALCGYTSQLERLGFSQLTDYTLPGAQGSQPVARLFVHHQKFCLAEVGCVGASEVFCSILGYLENDWSLGVTNAKVSLSLAATSHAFLRLPKRLGKYVEEAQVDFLFESFLDWRKQISQDLALELIEDIDAELHFQKEREVRMHQRRSLLQKSILWSLVEMFLFSLNPKTEWLGAYKSFDSK